MIPTKTDATSVLVNYLIEMKGIDKSKTAAAFDAIIDVLEGKTVENEEKIVENEEELFNKDYDKYKLFSNMYKR